MTDYTTAISFINSINIIDFLGRIDERVNRSLLQKPLSAALVVSFDLCDADRIDELREALAMTPRKWRSIPESRFFILHCFSKSIGVVLG